MNLLRIPAKVVCAECETTEDVSLEITAARIGTNRFLIAEDIDRVPTDIVVGSGDLPTGWESENPFADFFCPACKNGPRKV